MEVDGRTVTNIPRPLKYPIPSLKSRKKRDLQGPPENGTAKLHSSKVAEENTYCSSDKGVPLTRGGCVCVCVCVYVWVGGWAGGRVGARVRQRQMRGPTVGCTVRTLLRHACPEVRHLP